MWLPSTISNAQLCAYQKPRSSGRLVIKDGNAKSQSVLRLKRYMQTQPCQALTAAVRIIRIWLSRRCCCCTRQFLLDALKVLLLCRVWVRREAPDDVCDTQVQQCFAALLCIEAT